MFGRRKAENLELEDLERMLHVKRRQSRLERFQRLSQEGYSVNEALVGAITRPLPAPDPNSPSPANVRAPVAASLNANRPEDGFDAAGNGRKKRSKKIANAFLLSLEVVALVGLVGVLVASYFNLKELNSEVSLAQQNMVDQLTAAAEEPAGVGQTIGQETTKPAVAAPVALARLPGGHSPPTAPGGAVPDVPLHLQHWVQQGSPSPANLLAAGAIQVEPQDSAPPTRIVIPRLNVNAPVVGGVGWEDLKKGVGHLPGSANPGERGNMYLAAHNDIYGEIFRYLEDLEVGDEYFIYAGAEEFRYVVQEKRIIEPTDVEVMLPTTKPVATLQTCYPYMVDTHRLVVIGELAE